MLEDLYPVRWTGRQAVVSLPDHIDVSNASKITDELLSLINRGAAPLIVDMTATASCDHAGADAIARAYQRAAANGIRLRLVVTAQIVRRTLAFTGLDRLVSIYPSLEAAAAAGEPAPVVPPEPSPAAGEPDDQSGAGRAASRRQQRQAGPRRGPGGGAVTQTVLRGLIDALADGVALADDDGMLALVNRRLGDMFGYAQAELAGQPVELLIPADLRASHRGHRAVYARAPRARQMGEGIRLVGLRKDGTTFPVEVSLSPVPTATGHLTLAVVRDVTGDRQSADLLDLARAAVAAEQAHRTEDLLDRVVSSLFDVGLSLQAAVELPHHVARRRVIEALQHLDDTIHEIRDHLFATRGRWPQSGSAPPNGAH